MFGIGCLLTAHWMQPEHRLLFALPGDPVGWTALLFGIAGLSLVPGLWLSALVARTGAGQPAWLGARIATTLVWYALLGPVIHRSAEGAKVTTGGLLIATVAVTTAVLIGVALGLSRWPSRLWMRLLIPAIVGAVGAQTTIWVWMRVWTFDMNYEHIRRLDWLIVLCGALFVILGTLTKPKMPAVRTKRQLVQILVAIAVVAATFGAIRLTSAMWSPAQQMPSVISAEQVTARPGTELTFTLNAIGPEGVRLFEHAAFTVVDDTGRPVPASTRIEASETSAAQGTLDVVLAPDARPMLCTSIQAAKVTVRDQASGLQVQAFVPDGWCAR
ncbi:hypothetical protein C6A87_023500 [Mycobacterium sp. ITM-2016-00317]|uniref:hypothetical protein n=1 Tax=Mycobacterium sp. ITM-2016-00317 TaxID=2099694 RepID=UPI00287FBAA1|nr:hypothetical protein [Mycobacterium sp. ITM-2016-00317]WNG86740.1 hypothetical protein C6A87_023500 [Mycobacterium sp. ITM-2016-00317]